jgi:aminoglycoside phosphotransferase (APT) family kinase protein
MIEEEQAIELSAAAMGVRPLRAIREPLSKSGKAVFRIELPNQQTVALRTSDRPRTFAFTQRNFDVLRELGLPVPMVLAQGPTADGGSFIILDWIPGRDLVHELGSMSRTQITRLAEQMVELQQRVAGLPESTGFGWAPIRRNGPLQEWTQVFGETAPAAAVDEDTIMGRFRGRLRRVRSGLEPYFRTVRPRCFLDDLTLKNALVHDGALSGVIDVDFACYGDPLLAIGATLASIAADVGERGSFYGEELIRCWNPDRLQLRAIWFYASLWAIGFLSMTDANAEPARAESLSSATECWLRRAEADLT